MTRRPSVLLIAPTLPAKGGSGLGIRAGMILEALARDHDVSLLVVPVTGTAPATGVSPFVARLTVRAVIADLAGLRTDSHLSLIARVRDPAAREEALRAFPRPLLTGVATRDAVAALTSPLASVPFDLVFVMRLYLAPFAAPWLDAPNRPRRPRWVIDVDDDEVRTHQALAALHRARGDATAASRATREAERYALFERECLPRFDRVLVGTAAERTSLETRLSLQTVRVVPNAVRLPLSAPGPRPAAWRLLFVGSLGYAPNADAADVLCQHVLPRLRAGGQHAVEVEIVGMRPPPEVARLAELPGVRVVPDAPSVAPHYARCRLAVAPIRAGGSTRIKILEAFAHRRPVVSTRQGAEGLDALDGVHLLLADEPAGFADACLRLLRDDELAERLTASSAELVVTRFALPVMTHRIADLCRELLGS